MPIHSTTSYEFMLSNDPVNFYDNSFTDPNYNIDLISWEWDFGDGVISNDQNPSHIPMTTQVCIMFGLQLKMKMDVHTKQ